MGRNAVLEAEKVIEAEKASTPVSFAYLQVDGARALIGLVKHVALWLG